MLLYINFPVWIKPEIIPGLPLRWYGLMYLLAFFLTYFIFNYQIKKKQLSIEPDQVSSFFFWVILGLLLGARLFSTLFFSGSDYYWSKPWMIIWPFNEAGQFQGFRGMNFIGGIIGALTAAFIFLWLKKQNTLLWCDLLAAAVPLGYALGKIGNFVNSELYGRVTSAPWGVVFRDPKAVLSSKTDWVGVLAAKLHVPVAEGSVNLPRHPVQLYDGLFVGIGLWLMVWFVFRKKNHFVGYLAGVYVLCFCTLKFLLGYFQMPGILFKVWPVQNPPELLLSPFNISLEQIFYLFLIAASLFFIRYLRARNEFTADLPAAVKKTTSRSLRKKINHHR